MKDDILDLRDMIIKYSKEESPKVYNKIFLKMHAYRKELYDNNRIFLLESLLDDNNAYCRLFAAASLLIFPRTQMKAEEVLKELSVDSKEDISRIQFTAEMTLKEWEKGTLGKWLDW